MLNKEIWKDITGYELYYEVSNTGKVRNKRTGRILKPFINTCNHYNVGLSVDGNLKRYLIHRLVAIEFIPNPNNFDVINHKDGNPANNNVDNLEWCTQKQNLQHAFNTGLYPFRNVICIETGEIFQRPADAARKYKMNSGMMHRLLHESCKSWHGLHFKYND